MKDLPQDRRPLTRMVLEPVARQVVRAGNGERVRCCRSMILQSHPAFLAPERKNLAYVSHSCCARYMCDAQRMAERDSVIE